MNQEYTTLHTNAGIISLIFFGCLVVYLIIGRIKNKIIALISFIVLAGLGITTIVLLATIETKMIAKKKPNSFLLYELILHLKASITSLVTVIMLGIVFYEDWMMNFSSDLADYNSIE
jgi:hypothetical protein